MLGHVLSYHMLEHVFGCQICWDMSCGVTYVGKCLLASHMLGHVLRRHLCWDMTLVVTFVGTCL